MIPYAGQIIQLLTPLWGPNTEPLLKSSLVVTFTKITSVRKKKQVTFYQLINPPPPLNRSLMNNPLSCMKYLSLLYAIVLTAAT